MGNKIVMYCVENEAVRGLASILEQKGVSGCFVEGEEELFHQLEKEDIRLVIMEISGQPEELKLLSIIREKSNVPVIAVSGEESESTKIMTFRAGADDYILIGCSPLEILERIQVQLRRYMQLAGMRNDIGRIWQIGELVIDDRARKVMVSGRDVNLTPIEYKILKLLVQQQGKAVSIPQIYEAVWHMKAVGADNTIAVHICHIREKIERNPRKPQYLKVVWGVGYKVG